jgi:hypothetical protein
MQHGKGKIFGMLRRVLARYASLGLAQHDKSLNDFAKLTVWKVRDE